MRFRISPRTWVCTLGAQLTPQYAQAASEAGGGRSSSRQPAPTAYADACPANPPPGDADATSRPATAGPASPMTDSAVRTTPLAPCTSRATRGTVLATPGWNIAAATP